MRDRKPTDIYINSPYAYWGRPRIKLDESGQLTPQSCKNNSLYVRYPDNNMPMIEINNIISRPLSFVTT